MALLSQIRSDLYIQGALSAQSIQYPNGSIVNEDINALAAIDASKMTHRYAVAYSQADGSDVAAAIVPVHIVRGTTATIEDIEVVCVDAPSGGDKTFTVDVQYGNASSALASVLSSAITYPNGTADLTVRSGTLTTTSLSAADTLVVVVAVSGSTGSQGQGLIVNIALTEDPA
jgi:hypothetical protein